MSSVSVELPESLKRSIEQLAASAEARPAALAVPSASAHRPEQPLPQHGRQRWQRCHSCAAFARMPGCDALDPTLRPAPRNTLRTISI